MSWCHPVIAVFMFRVGCIIGFTVAAFTCFAKGSEGELSTKDKKTVRSSLYSLFEGVEAREKIRVEKLREQERLRERMQKLRSAMEDIDKYMENSRETEDSGETEDLEESEGEWVFNYKKDARLKRMFAVRNSSYVKALFQNDPKLKEWIKRKPEMLFFAVQLGNLDLVQFFVEEGGMINAVREFTHFSLLHVAIIAGRLNVIRFFLE